MAVSNTVRRALRRTAETLTEFAKQNGWKNEDYGIYYWINEDWDKVHIVFVARAFDGSNEFENNVRVREFLATKLSDEPELLNSVGLVVRSERKTKEGGIYALGPQYLEFWTMSPA